MTTAVPCPLPGDISFCEPEGDGPFLLRIGTAAIELGAPGSDLALEAEAMRTLMMSSSAAAAALDRRARSAASGTEAP